MAKTRYSGVFVDTKGKYFYETELGIDRISGKRIRKKVEKIATVSLFLLPERRI